jgi:amphiphysin|tara:strand:+ start:1041 stop:1607 length:567 start_codon:yes stop_codon:yes gene_type:complete|eukprot:31017-Pelagococcus_subviridis.AAC.18
MHAAARTMAGHIAELTEMDPDEPLPDPGPISPGGTGPVSREAVVDRAARLTEVMDALENDVKPLCLEQLDSAVVAPVSQLVDDFPAYAPCVDKRRAYMLDVDAYERKLDKARTKSKDPGMAPHREEQYARAQRRFAHFSDKLVEDLTLLDANRFELAAFLLEGFIETQDFMMQRTRDVHSVIVKKSAD